MENLLAKREPEWEATDERVVKWDREQTEHLMSRLASVTPNPITDQKGGENDPLPGCSNSTRTVRGCG